MKVFQAIFYCLIFANSTFAQSNNVLLSRDFWKTNPTLELLKQKIAEGNDPTELNESAYDPTVYAILEKADFSVISYLLTIKGNSAQKLTHDSRTYLHWAANVEDLSTLKLLFEKGASTNIKDSHGYTPLAYAASNGYKTAELFELFQKNGCNLLTEKNDDGANLFLLNAPYFKTRSDIDYFISKGFKITDVDSKNNNIFSYLTRGGKRDLLLYATSKGVDFKTLNNDGANAFSFAVQGVRGNINSIEFYEYLRLLGLKVNIVDNTGSSPLHTLSSSSNDPQIINYFLDQGANVNQQDSKGNTAFMNACARNKSDIVNILLPKTSNINLQNKEGINAIMMAVRSNSIDVLNLLIDKGADLSLKDAKGNDLSYHLVASFSERKQEPFIAKADLLKKAGFQIGAIQSKGNSLIHQAIYFNSISLLKLLEAYNIPIDYMNEDGMTALHLAAMKASDDSLLKYLIERGASVTIKTSMGESVMDLAKENEVLSKKKVSLAFLN